MPPSDNPQPPPASLAAEERDDAPPPGYGDAARVASLAEAGYLVSLLEAEGLEAVVRHNKTFSATSGAWSTNYVVQAPSDRLHDVAAVLRSEAAAMNDEAEQETDDEQEFRQVVWRPVALMAVAGVVSFLAGQHLAATKPSGAPRDLAEAVGRVGRPFYSPADADGARHRLFYDARSGDWLLDTDADADGRYDRRSRFTAEPSVEW